jgi:hypothetical protein
VDVVDPVSVIMAALAAGAAAGLSDTGSTALKDAYQEVKRLAATRFRGRPAGEVALERHSAKPEQWGPALEAELAEAGAAEDHELLEAADRLLGLVDAGNAERGEYTVHIFGSQAVQIGDRNVQSNTFGSAPRRDR